MVDTITWGVIGINDISVIWLEITANINLADTYLANPTNFNGMQMQNLGNRMSEFCDSKGLDWSQMPYRAKVTVFRSHMLNQGVELKDATSRIIRQAMAPNPFG